MKQLLLLILASFSILTFFLSSITGREGNWASAPNDNGDCSSCHTSQGNGNIELTGAPLSYQPGQTYTMTLKLSDFGASVGGFQIVATNGTSNGQVGSFTPGTGQRLNGVSRLVQSMPKAFMGGFCFVAI